MANSKNDKTLSITGKQTVPTNVTKQGTVITLGTNVEGSDTLTYGTLVGAFTIGATVTGGTTGATGVIYADSGTVLKLSNIKGVFLTTEVLTDSATAVTAAVNGVPTYTLFSQQCQVGDFMYVAAQSEVHKITYISNDLSMQIQEAFTTPLAGAALLISPCSPRPKEISVIIPSGGAAGLIDGVSIPSGVAWNSNKTSQYNNGRDDGFIDPIIVDATGTTMIAQINY